MGQGWGGGAVEGGGALGTPLDAAAVAMPHAQNDFDQANLRLLRIKSGT
jgi:hypothetical protein